MERDVGLHALLDAPDQFPNYVLSTDDFRWLRRRGDTRALPALARRRVYDTIFCGVVSMALRTFLVISVALDMV